MSEICLCDDLISLKSKQKFQLSFLFVLCYGVDKCDSEGWIPRTQKTLI